jgi:hypothetical protein
MTHFSRCALVQQVRGLRQECRYRGHYEPGDNDEPPLVRLCHAVALFLARAQKAMTLARLRLQSRKPPSVFFIQ